MRNLLLLTLSAVLMLTAACSQKSENAYTITGTAEGTQDGDTVFICEMQGYFNMVPTDTAIIKDGKFEFNGECEGAALRWLMPFSWRSKPSTLEKSSFIAVPHISLFAAAAPPYDRADYAAGAGGGSGRGGVAQLERSRPR